MSFFSRILITVVLICTTSCGSGSLEEGTKYSGIIEATGITSYQYGTHTLKTEKEFYALKSDAVDLSEFEGESVTITAEKIEGYPVDGGPVYLKVNKVENK